MDSTNESWDIGVDNGSCDEGTNDEPQPGPRHQIGCEDSEEEHLQRGSSLWNLRPCSPEEFVFLGKAWITPNICHILYVPDLSRHANSTLAKANLAWMNAILSEDNYNMLSHLKNHVHRLCTITEGHIKVIIQEQPGNKHFKVQYMKIQCKQSGIEPTALSAGWMRVYHTCSDCHPVELGTQVDEVLAE
ncbi:hypothetical protein BV22DRAFT_1183702 [Leucogyrophana mollusca]|uniref:Uncharacterized protein n=1 Tax=Leucogyrophana mollusca TaxID=85980 RepID=A0ACB8B1D9_9AGAM|nr:hypothetical protein BV22DRAFT_1183702 [Leucogyrophana mollusca]